MANLNFQQPPRSIAAGSLVSRGGGAGTGGSGFGVSSSTAFPTPPPQQPSPASQNTTQQRQAQLLGRGFTDRRAGMPGVTGVNSNSMVGVRGGLQGVVMGSGDATGSIVAPPLLDPSEFPSLTVRGQGDQPHHHIAPPGTKPYVGMVKQPTAEHSEFTMSSEDFPALPGTSVGGSGTIGGGGVGPTSGSGPGLSLGPGGLQPNQTISINTSIQGQSEARDGSQQNSQHDHGDRHGHGIQSFPDGKVTNIPPSMVPNQFGMVGLLTFIRAAESDSELVSLALGQDLTTLGLNLNSPENLYLTFAGPWAESPCRPQDIDYHVPPEYLINMSIREKLAPVKLNRYKEDLLFYLFYCFVGDVLQLAAASELYNREWRYHTEEKVWITQAPGVTTLEKTTTYERGTYYYFDAQSWRKQTKEFHLDYSKLEGRPQMPTHFQLEHSKQQHFHT